MMAFLRERLAHGPVYARIMAVGGNAQVSLKVQIKLVDEVGMVDARSMRFETLRYKRDAYRGRS